MKNQRKYIPLQKLDFVASKCEFHTIYCNLSAGQVLFVNKVTFHSCVVSF
jgi:hypothetical protein